MKLKYLKLLGAVMAFLLCFLIHFLYDLAPSFITSVIAPVNESIAEHMKILFGSILFSGVIQKIIVKVKHLPYKNVCISNVIASLLSIPIFLIIYMPIYNAIGENFLLTISLMLLVIIISQIITIFIINIKKDLHMENASILFVIIIYMVFLVLTYDPPEQSIFMDPITLNYGIKK